MDVRLLAATNKDLASLVQSGRFREDLFYRLNVVAVKLPPLRDRADEIPGLAERLLARHAGRIGMPPRKEGQVAIDGR